MNKFDPTRPKWQQIAETIRRRIADGTYPPQHRLSEVKLSEEFDVTRVTVRKAIADLRKDELITTTPGMGSFVKQKGD
ncbi:GntR family transcriptional regulator [Streptomyces sp. 4R-3d]|uniref:GntR family transcriptional regulator n=1 Tax=Streptomyces sp. 4R-3d TaxID=2559605 RepID=UPI0010725A39|nr:GntR family transcriptional regulator [Streptomyces sp. 4R-3d]TFI25542.1 GntR family transcriptional regulator [Streptomyces sp. 4R-3d]